MLYCFVDGIHNGAIKKVENYFFSNIFLNNNYAIYGGIFLASYTANSLINIVSPKSSEIDRIRNRVLCCALIWGILQCPSTAKNFSANPLVNFAASTATGALTLYINDLACGTTRCASRLVPCVGLATVLTVALFTKSIDEQVKYLAGKATSYLLK